MVAPDRLTTDWPLNAGNLKSDQRKHHEHHATNHVLSTILQSKNHFFGTLRPEDPSGKP
jgi:hypothetical protein